MIKALPASWPPLHAVMIDLDGTLVDTTGDFVAVLHHTLADLGAHAVEIARVDAAFVEATVGKGTEDLLRRTLAHAWGLPDHDPQLPALLAQAWRLYHEHYERLNGAHSQVFPGVVQGLQALRAAALPLACLTNKPTALAEQLLLRKGLREHFGPVFGGDAFERRKPDPLPLLRTCQALGTWPAGTLMVGDSSNDARAAQAAGCPVVLLTYGYNHGEPVTQVPALAHIARLDALDWSAWAARR